MERERYKVVEGKGEVETREELRTELQPSSKAAELAALLERHRGERHIIVLQSFPDPDAISSALAHQMIAARYGIECDIAYDGAISHHENVALVELLDISLIRLTERDDVKRYQASVFVDTQGTTTTRLTERLAEAGVPVLAIVDHHEFQNVVEAEFVDIRQVGATATIYTEYLEQGLLPLDRSDESHVRLATALMHGIRSETGGMVRARREDYLAAAYLSEFVNQTTLAAILSIERSRKAMDIIKTALEARVVRDNYSIAGVGYVRYEDRDAIPQAADFLLTEENVHTAIVYGIVIKPGEREMVIGSLRTRKATLNPDAFLKEALGSSESGRYYGGGRREAGGFEIPVGFLAGNYEEEFMRWKWYLYDRQIKRKFWTKLGVLEAIEQQSEEEV
ncbi:bifunctional oligoribonuclease/PAP phosphatase NrnA [Pyrinomonas sp.]|uniref:DHH family phosphoesterase n=1 Tax=Pyrinomonas sp. TaxID=2080306 RepID=UPI00332F06EF